MKQLIIICEGPTEVQFCKDILHPFLLSKGIAAYYPLISKSGGGIVAWKTLKLQLERHLREPSHVTMLIDYYGIPDRYAYPKWEESKSIGQKEPRMEFLEKAMWENIGDPLNRKFIPNILLHEFEGLLFNNMAAFERVFEDREFLDKRELAETIRRHPNPELINDTPHNAPSKRLHRMIKGYNKVTFGNLIAEAITLDQMRVKSPHFNTWLSNIENI